MATEPGDPRTDEEVEEGGPVKSFLEHLEDLRWVLIKSVVAIAIFMVVCLIGADYVLSVVKWPLVRADKFRKQPDTELAFLMGTNVFTTHPGTNFLREIGFTNQTRLGF